MYGVYNTYRNKIYDNAQRLQVEKWRYIMIHQVDIVSLEINCGM